MEPSKANPQNESAGKQNEARRLWRAGCGVCNIRTECKRIARVVFEKRRVDLNKRICHSICARSKNSPTVIWSSNSAYRNRKLIAAVDRERQVVTPWEYLCSEVIAGSPDAGGYIQD